MLNIMSDIASAKGLDPGEYISTHGYPYNRDWIPNEEEYQQEIEALRQSKQKWLDSLKPKPSGDEGGAPPAPDDDGGDDDRHEDGDGDGDDEQITVDLANMANAVGKIVFVVNIYACEQRKQDFGMIKNAFIRLVDSSTGKEICRYNLSEKYSGRTAMIFAEVYKKDNEWKFNAIGQGTTDASISSLVKKYK